MQIARRELRAHTDSTYEDEFICLHFVGDIFCTRHSEIGYHRNPGFEICLIPTGKGLFKIDNDMFPVENDHLFLTKTHQVHGGWPSLDAPFRIQYLCFSVKGGHCSSDPFWVDVHNRLTSIPHPVCTDHESLQPLHMRLMREISERRSDHEQVILSISVILSKPCMAFLRADTERNLLKTIQNERGLYKSMRIQHKDAASCRRYNV